LDNRNTVYAFFCFSLMLAGYIFRRLWQK